MLASHSLALLSVSLGKEKLTMIMRMPVQPPHKCATPAHQQRIVMYFI